jgi:hypothetical protein
MSQYNRLLKSLAMNANNRKIESEASGGTNYYTTGATLGGNNILTGSTQASTWTADLSALAAVGTIGGSITDNQIAIGATTANSIEGANTFKWDASTLTMTNAGNTAITVLGNSNRSSSSSHAMAMRGMWDGTAIGTVMIQTGPDTTNKDDGRIVMYTASAGTQAERMTILHDGNVGIGTTTPAKTLHIKKDAGHFRISSADYDLISMGPRGDSGSNLDKAALNMMHGDGSSKIYFDTGGDSYIKGAGNLGIQTSSPNFTLDVVGTTQLSGNSSIVGTLSTTGVATLGDNSVTNTQTAGNNSTRIATTAFVTAAVAANTGTPGGSDTQVQFNDGGSFGGSANLTWDDSDLAIGNSGKLKVVNASSNYWAMYNQSNGKMRIDQGTTQRVLASSGEFQFANDIIVDSKVGIGGVTPSYPLHVAQGTATYGIYMPNSNSRGIRFGDTSNNGTGYGRIEGIGGSLFLGSTQIYTSFIGTGDSNTTLGSQGRRWSYFFTRFGQVGYDTSTTTTAQFGISGASDKVPLEVYANGATAPAIHVTSGSLVGVGLDTPTSDLHIKGELDIQSGNQTILMGAGNSSTARSNDTLKLARVGLAHYHNAEEPVAMLYAASNGTDNTVVMGGGTSGMNAATRLQFATAVNDATTAGTVRASIQGDANYDKLFLGADTTLGFYRYSNRMDFYISSNPRMHLDASKLYSATSGGPLLDLTPTTNEANYGFVDDPDTGMSRTAANTLVLMTAGTTRMTISSAGNATFTEAVTLGDNSITNTQSLGNSTTRLATTEFVAAALTAGGYGNVSKVGTPANNQIGVWTGDGTIEGDANLTYDGSNVNVGTKVELQGAGTSTFSAANTVFGASDVSQNTYLKVLGSGAGYTAAGIKLLTYNGSNRPGGVYSYNNVDAEAWYSGPVYGNSFKWGVNYKSSLADTGSALEAVAAVGNNLLTIDTAGNVGIGTSSPQKKLHVEGDIAVSGASTAGDAGKGHSLFMYNQSGTQVLDMYADSRGASGGKALDMNVSGRLNISSTEHMGIGPSSSGEYLHLFSGPTAHMYFDAGDSFLFRDKDDSSAIRARLYTASGRFILNDSTPATQIELNPEGVSYIAGNFGVGLGNPQSFSDRFSAQIATNSGWPIGFTNAAEDVKGGIRTDQGDNYIAFASKSASDIRLFYNDNEANTALIVKGAGATAGNVGIGTTGPNYSLEVYKADADGNPAINISDGATYLRSTITDAAYLQTDDDLYLWTRGSGKYAMLRSSGSTVTVQANQQLYLKSGDTTALTLDTSQNATFAGTISATAKSFNIPHPLYKDKRLVHGSLEGPEHAIYIRGTIETEEKGCLVELPEYWSAMCEDYTVQLTPHGPYTVYIKEKLKDKVMIECSQKKFKFDYYIVGARTDETLEVVQDGQ